MGLVGPSRPRVSRETRLLLVTILVSIAVLWALARLRFPDRPVTPNPVPPLLTQLTAPPGFDDLASEVSKLDVRLLPSLASVGPSISLRVRDNVGAMFTTPDGLGAPASSDDSARLARDPASGLTLVSIPGAPAPEVTPWTPAQPARSRFMIASDVSPLGVSLRPVFIGRLHPSQNPAWPGDVLVLPARTDVTPGDFLFTIDGALAGLVIPHAGATALVPGDTLLQAVHRLFEQKGHVGGWLGVEVQAPPVPVTSATQTTPGVIVTWVHPDGPSAGKLFVMDVIEAAGDGPISSPEHWRVRVARLTTGASIVVRVRRGTETLDVPLTASVRASPPDSAALGLTLRTVRRVGVEVLEVAGGSSAARAGILTGDVITAIGDIRAPTAQQVTKAFDAAPADGAVPVAITRGSLHRILVLERK